MTSIDLRSDTVTQPGPAMRQAIADAVVGDDVFGDDPTMNALQERMATLLGKEAALFVPSGTMANQLAIRVQSHHGAQVVVEAGSHVVRYEAGAPAALSGVLVTTIETDDGVLTWDLVEPSLNPDDQHCAPPTLVCVENTHNRHGGRVVPLEAIESLARAAHARGLRVHLDGARLWNAAVATGIPLAAWTAPVDSVSVCFSKGLGAPIGSVLAGDAVIVHRARRVRKQWGGGMRQVGLLAAACLYALEHHVDRLRDDHANARRLAEGIRHPDLRLVTTPQTNIVLFDVEGTDDASALLKKLQGRGVLASAMGPRRLRLVTHLGVSRADCERAITVVNGLAQQAPPPAGG